MRPQAGTRPKAAYETALARLEAVDGRARAPAARWTIAAIRRHQFRAAGLEHDARGIRSDGREGQGLHPRRRHLSGGAVAALRVGLPPARLCALPLLAAGQSGAVPLLPRLRGLSRSSAPRRRFSSAFATARSRSGRSPAPAPAARPRPRTAPTRTACSPTRRSAPST